MSSCFSVDFYFCWQNENCCEAWDCQDHNFSNFGLGSILRSAMIVMTVLKWKDKIKVVIMEDQLCVKWTWQQKGKPYFMLKKKLFYYWYWLLVHVHVSNYNFSFYLKCLDHSLRNFEWRTIELKDDYIVHKYFNKFYVIHVYKLKKHNGICIHVFVNQSSDTFLNPYSMKRSWFTSNKMPEILEYFYCFSACKIPGNLRLIQ